MANTRLDQLLASTITADGVVLQLTDGSAVGVVGNVGSAFRFAGGEILVADQSSGQWTRLA